MICPLKKLGLMTATQSAKSEYCQCDEKDCAWWHVVDAKCSVASIADSLDAIVIK